MICSKELQRVLVSCDFWFWEKFALDKCLAHVICLYANFGLFISIVRFFGYFCPILLMQIFSRTKSRIRQEPSVLQTSFNFSNEPMLNGYIERFHDCGFFLAFTDGCYLTIMYKNCLTFLAASFVSTSLIWNPEPNIIFMWFKFPLYLMLDFCLFFKQTWKKN